uniref:Ig-like domain-containing protein n=1 Tax=Stomoxys calcitrans TaxID=35570 RepID=A0A1I8NMA3_STOCA
FILALRNVSVTIPLAVKRGDNAILICNYDIENDTLYTVKWYRGRREFYRYTPKENPAWKIFPSAANGLSVDTTQSNASHVLIRNVPLSISGRYACEVSADAPSFHTTMMMGIMDVVELPTQRPIITGIHSRYRLGDVINGNCSSDYSKPAANLTWWINDIQVPPNYLRTYDIQKHVEEQMESAVLEINFIVTLQHFIKGRLKLKCSARIHRIYHAETEKYLEEDRPRILASGRSPDVYHHNDEFDDENGLYLTHYTNYHSSAESFMGNLNRISRHMCVLMPILSCLLFSFNQNLLTKPWSFLQICRRKYRRRCHSHHTMSRVISTSKLHEAGTTGVVTKASRIEPQHCYHINWCCLNKRYVNNNNNGANNKYKRNASQFLCCFCPTTTKCQRRITVIATLDNVRHAER